LGLLFLEISDFFAQKQRLLTQMAQGLFAETNIPYMAAYNVATILRLIII